MTSSLTRTAAAAAIFGLILTGCSSDHSMDGDDMAAISEMSGPMADIAFAQMMIPHHEQAIVMSDYALRNTTNPQILELAGEISAAQDPEIAQMTAMLERFGADMGGHEGHVMAGMLTDDELAALDAARGPQFDVLFLEAMIAHHVGAIDMAEDVLASGSDPEVRALAEEIISAQQAEIDAMTMLLAK